MTVRAPIRRKHLGTGWKFPLAVDAQGRIACASEETRIEEAIHFILGTALGERVMRPGFGSIAHDALFAPASRAQIASLVDRTRRALIRYENRIDILELDAEVPPGAPSTLIVRLVYRVRATNTIGNIVHPFYLSEGEGTA